MGKKKLWFLVIVSLFVTVVTCFIAASNLYAVKECTCTTSDAGMRAEAYCGMMGESCTSMNIISAECQVDLCKTTYRVTCSNGQEKEISTHEFCADCQNNSGSPDPFTGEDPGAGRSDHTPLDASGNKMF